MNILKRTFNRVIKYIVNKIIFSWLDSSWLEKSGYVPRMDIAMPPLEISFVYLELSNDIESFYSSSIAKS
jgi:hypothetical protein